MEDLCKDEHRIDALIISNSEQGANKLAQMFSHTKINESDLWHEHKNGIDIYTSLRWPNCVITSSPIGASYILMVYLSHPQSEQMEYIKEYVDQRKEIPYKYFISEGGELASKADEMGCEYIRLSEIKEVKWKEKLIRSVKQEDHILKSVFSKIDKDKDGVIDAHEIMNLAKSLNYSLNYEDAKEIISLLSVQGKIDYHRFKEWWIMGRSDFPSFRKLCQIQYFFNNFFNFHKLDHYIKERIFEGSNFFIKPKVTSSVNIKPDKDFESKTTINFHASMGNDFKDAMKAFPESVSNSPFSLGIEFFLLNEIDGPGVIKDLKEIHSKLATEDTTFRYLMEKGLVVNFRHVGTSVFVDFAAHDSLADFVEWHWSQNYSFLNVTGVFISHLCSKMSIQEILQAPLEDFISQILNFKLETRAEYFQQKVFDLVIQYIYPHIEKNLLLQAMSKIISSTRKADLDLLFSPNKLENFFVDFMKEMEIDFLELCKTKRSEFKQNFDYILNQIRNLVDKKTLKMINPNLLSFYASLHLSQIYWKTNLVMSDMDKLVDNVYKTNTL